MIVIKKLFKNRFIRFCFVGGLATITNFLVFSMLLRFLHLHYLISAAIGFMCGVVVGYNLNSKFTFNKKGSPIKYFGIYTITLFLSLLLLRTLVEIFGINVYISNIITIGIITFINFTGVRLFVFN